MMSRIMEAWDNLLRQAIDRDEDTRHYALFQIALILERHYAPNQNAPTLYEENLSRELLRLTLSPQRQEDAVQYLLKLATHDMGNADVYLHGVACADPAVSVGRLLAWLEKYAHPLTGRGIYQVLQAWRAAWRAQDEGGWVRLCEHPQTQMWLASWATHEDEDIARHARELYDKVSTS